MHRNNILVYKSQQDAQVTQFILSDTALHVSGVTITHLQEHKTTASTTSGNHYTVIDRVKFTDKTRLKLQLLNSVYSLSVNLTLSITV